MLIWIFTLAEVILGLIIPLYKTMHTLEESADSKVADKYATWTMYWIIFTFIEYITAFFPESIIYSILKLALILYLTSSKTDGSRVCFQYVSRIVLSKSIALKQAERELLRNAKEE